MRRTDLGTIEPEEILAQDRNILKYPLYPKAANYL